MVRHTEGPEGVQAGSGVDQVGELPAGMVPVPVPTLKKVMVPVPVPVPTFEKLRFQFRFQLHI